MKRLSMLAAAALLAGCATFSDDGGMGAVQQAVKERTGADIVRDGSGAARVAALLRAPLTMEGAVQLALLNHRGLQAQFAQLGVVEADLVQAGRIPNPGFTFARSTRGDEIEYERGLHFGLGALLALPLARAVEERRFAQAQGAAVLAVLNHAADTRRAWVQAVAARETLRYTADVVDAADAGAELARRMAAAGNFSRLQRAREEAFHADAQLAHARAQAQAQATRERLLRLLGLWGDEAAALQLPERLPDLPATPDERPDIEREALAQRLDVRAARQQLDLTAKQLGLVKTSRFVNAFEIGLLRNGSNEAPTQRGWEIGFELPVFDFGGARVARAERVVEQATHQAAQVAIDARSEVREAYAAYRHAWDLARHQRDTVVPLAKTVSDENLLRYNGMLIGVFELLADARAQVAAVTAAIGATRDFWLAEADLRMALVGRPQLAGPAAPTLAAPAADPGH